VQKITIAIDGFSSCGKSTLAKALAQKLSYKYIDTGAMYRAVTWFALERGFINDANKINQDNIINALPEVEIRFAVNPETYNSDVYLNDLDIEQQIRKMAVSRLVSKVSAIREVREKMVALQRQMGKGKGVILDGRDIGTHVFPKAELKLFMTADNDVRAKRRMDEYSSKGQYFSLEEVKQSLKERDNDDLNRKESPLIKADDAIILDNSDLNKEEQLEFVLKLIYDLQYISKEEQSHH
jgi:cytidylate kinase